MSVAGAYPTRTTVASSGSAGNYTLTATVGGTAAAAPTGTVSFLDSGNGDALLATATLGAGTPGLLGFFDSASLEPIWEGPDFPPAIVLGDFNADGIPDVALIAASGLVYLGNGDGTFAPAPPLLGSFDGFYEFFTPVVADFNGDGIPDLAAIGGTDVHTCVSPNCLYALLGNGDGTFTPGRAQLGLGDRA